MAIKTIKKGKKDWKPFSFPCPIFLKKIHYIEYSIIFDKSCWYDWQGDKDQEDWNKGGGWTAMWSLNNVDTNMWVWKPNIEKENSFHIGIYSNIGKEFIEDKLTTVDADKKTVLRLYPNGKKFTIVTNGVEKTHENRRAFNFCRLISEYFGGANNSPGPYGGVAPHDMKMTVERKIVKNDNNNERRLQYYNYPR